MRLSLSLLCIASVLMFYSPPELTPLQCGPAPQAPKCNLPKCTAEGWVFFPVARGTSCNTPEGPGFCDGGELGPPGQIEPNRMGQCIPIVSASLSPLYYVVHVVYSPPGTGGPGPKSSVTYADGSTLSTQTKTNSSFKKEVSVTAEPSIPGFSSFSASGGYAVTSVDEKGLTVSRTEQAAVVMQGGNTDGIDHDRDSIFLWINPMVNVSMIGDELKWTLGVDGPTMEIQHIHVGWLKDPSTMPPGVAQALLARDIRPVDFPAILLHDPFANGNTTIDTGRYVQTTTSFPYEPPFAAGEPALSYTLRVDNQTIVTQGSTRTNEYKVGLKGTIGVPLLSKLTVSTQFTWTNSTSTTNSSTGTQSASVTVTGPAFGYTGPTNMAVYYDTLYNTFMFAPIVHQPRLTGFVKTRLGRPIRHQAVTLTINRIRYNTITGRNGEYRFFGDFRGNGRLTTQGINKVVNLRGPALRQDLTPAVLKKPKKRNKE